MQNFGVFQGKRQFLGGFFIFFDDGDFDCFFKQLGDAAPPAQLCDKDVTPFAPDERPLSDDVTDVASPLYGVAVDIRDSRALAHRLLPIARVQAVAQLGGLVAKIKAQRQAATKMGMVLA